MTKRRCMSANIFKMYKKAPVHRGGDYKIFVRRLQFHFIREEVVPWVDRDIVDPDLVMQVRTC